MSETDIVARLRSYRPVTQFDSAGRMIKFSATPSPMELEAACVIERQSADLSRMREALEKLIDLDDRTELGLIDDFDLVEDHPQKSTALSEALRIARAALSPATEGE